MNKGEKTKGKRQLAHIMIQEQGLIHYLFVNEKRELKLKLKFNFNLNQ